MLCTESAEEKDEIMLSLRVHVSLYVNVLHVLCVNTFNALGDNSMSIYLHTDTRDTSC